MTISRHYKGVKPQHLTPSPKGLTKNQPLGRTVFWGRLRSSDKALEVVEYEESVDVYHDGQHIARWIAHGSVLWFGAGQAPEAGPGRNPHDPDEYPVPNCPECNTPMRLQVDRKRGRADSWFWGCPGWFSPRRCRGKIEFEPLPYDWMMAGGMTIGAYNNSLERLSDKLAAWRAEHAEINRNSASRRRRRAAFALGMPPP